MNAYGNKGKEYKPWLKPVNWLFFLSNTVLLSYDEYILYVRRNRSKDVTRATYSTIFILILGIGFQFITYDEIKELRLPNLFMVLIITTEFQMEFGLIWKLLIFPIIFGIHRLLMAIDQKCCGSKCYPIKRSVYEDLEIDP